MGRSKLSGPTARRNRIFSAARPCWASSHTASPPAGRSTCTTPSNSTARHEESRWLALHGDRVRRRSRLRQEGRGAEGRPEGGGGLRARARGGGGGRPDAVGGDAVAGRVRDDRAVDEVLPGLRRRRRRPEGGRG